MKLGRSLEDYLETILILKNHLGEVHSIDVARQMNFSKPSVSHAVKILQNKRYLSVDIDGSLHLTKKGSELANQIYERHRFFKDCLIEAGVAPDQAETDACQIEHVISEESFRKIKEAVKKEGW